MNRRQLPLSALRSFESAARHLSVSKAANELGVTHSAISHQIKRLEKELDTQLFIRTNRGLRITTPGEELKTVISGSFDTISESLKKLQSTDSTNTEKSQLRITCTPTFASKWLVPNLSDWYSNPDSAKIHLIPSLSFLDFDTDSIDVAIRCGIPPWGKLTHEPLMPIHLIPVCSPSYLKKHSTVTEPKDCLNRDLIHADVGDHGLGEEWGDWLTGCGLDRPSTLPGLSFHDPALAMQAAADGLGLAIGYRELIGDDLQSGKLVIACDRMVKHQYGYYLVYQDDVDQSSVMGFREWIQAAV